MYVRVNCTGASFGRGGKAPQYFEQGEVVDTAILATYGFDLDESLPEWLMNRNLVQVDEREFKAHVAAVENKTFKSDEPVKEVDPNTVNMEDFESLMRLTKKKLTFLATERGLSEKGNKPDIAQRIVTYYEGALSI